MLRVLSLVLLASAWLATAPAQAQFGSLFGSSVETVSTAEVQKILAQRQQVVQKAKAGGQQAPPPEVVLVDVRSDAEVAVSIIPGAITKKQFEKGYNRYKDKLVIPYCTIGGRSARYAKQLAGKGLRVKNYKGSILDWVGEELPVVTLKGEPTNRVHTYSDRYKIPAKYEQVTK